MPDPWARAVTRRGARECEDCARSRKSQRVTRRVGDEIDPASGLAAIRLERQGEPAILAQRVSTCRARYLSRARWPGRGVRRRSSSGHAEEGQHAQRGPYDTTQARHMTNLSEWSAAVMRNRTQTWPCGARWVARVPAAASFLAPLRRGLDAWAVLVRRPQ